MSLLHSNPKNARIAASGAIAASFLLDVAIKRAVGISDWDGLVLIPGLLDMHFAFNRGISFSLFWQDSTFGSVLLIAVLFVVALVFAVSAFRTSKPLVSAGAGLIVGGALGNLLDRITHGAVFDFLVVRLGEHPLFVCNSADVFISLGAAMLVADMLFPSLSGETASQNR